MPKRMAMAVPASDGTNAGAIFGGDDCLRTELMLSVQCFTAESDECYCSDRIPEAFPMRMSWFRYGTKCKSVTG